MEGVYLAALLPRLRKRIEDRICTGVGIPVRPGLGLRFGGQVLVLSALPDSPDLWWENEGCPMASASEVWTDHLEGARVTSVRQVGLDRVLMIELTRTMEYGEADLELIFEVTGRNANVVLVRGGDGRILACCRRVGPSKSRYRTIVPGAAYRTPPPSGLGPGEWAESRDALQRPHEEVTAEDVYSLLEGVGPAAADAILTEAADRGVSPFEVAMELQQSLQREDFFPWLGPRGPLPVRMGPGEPIDHPLSPQRPGKTTRLRDLVLREYLRHLDDRMERLQRRRDHAVRAMKTAVSPQTYREWGNLLLAKASQLRKGATTAHLEDWKENTVEIPLKPSRGPVENAQRYFRKARSCEREMRNLNEIVGDAESKIQELLTERERAPELSVDEMEKRLDRIRNTSTSRAERPLSEVPLAMGWRCYVGRNARENERLTFGLGRRGDVWLHARGETGGHVLLKRDGKPDNPPRRVLLQAAALAAYSSRGRRAGVVPVDYTDVRKVRRMKGGKPGQVVYSGESTLFVDLSSSALDGLVRKLDRRRSRKG